MRWRAGFTLVETVLAASLMVLVLGASLSIMGAALSWWQRGWDRMDAQQNARIALMHMTGEIQAASQVVSGSNSQTLIIEDTGGNQYKYELAGDNLRRAVKNKGFLDFSGYNPLAYGVRTLEFTYDRNPPEQSKMVTIHLVVRDGQGQDFAVTTTVALRLKVMNGES
ncbi:ComGF family competence protein [Neomoorella thermoacetica]|nr:ComGF family competence protein [Moorella thermoacetica]